MNEAETPVLKEASDVLAAVWTAMQNSADGDDLLNKLEALRESIEAAVRSDQTAALQELSDDAQTVYGEYRPLAQHKIGQWYPVQTWTMGRNKKLTWAAWRDNGSGVSEMRGPSGKALRFRSEAAAKAEILRRMQADHATGCAP